MIKWLYVALGLASFVAGEAAADECTTKMVDIARATHTVAQPSTRDSDLIDFTGVEPLSVELNCRHKDQLTIEVSAQTTAPSSTFYEVSGAAAEALTGTPAKQLVAGAIKCRDLAMKKGPGDNVVLKVGKSSIDCGVTRSALPDLPGSTYMFFFKTRPGE